MRGRGFVSALERDASLRYPLLRTTTTRGALHDEDIHALCEFMHKVVSANEPFIFLHDLRDFNPWASRSQIGAVRKFINEHAEALPSQLKATCVMRTRTMPVALAGSACCLLDAGCWLYRSLAVDVAWLLLAWSPLVSCHQRLPTALNSCRLRASLPTDRPSVRYLRYTGA